MNYWLMKSEPSAWSWDQQVKKKSETWNDVLHEDAGIDAALAALLARPFKAE